MKAFLELRKWRDAQQRALEAADKQQRLKEQQEAGGDEAPKVGAMVKMPVQPQHQASCSNLALRLPWLCHAGSQAHPCAQAHAGPHHPHASPTEGRETRVRPAVCVLRAARLALRL